MTTFIKAINYEGLKEFIPLQKDKIKKDSKKNIINNLIEFPIEEGIKNSIYLYNGLQYKCLYNFKDSLDKPDNRFKLININELGLNSKNFDVPDSRLVGVLDFTNGKFDYWFKDKNIKPIGIDNIINYNDGSYISENNSFGGILDKENGLFLSKQNIKYNRKTNFATGCIPLDNEEERFFEILKNDDIYEIHVLKDFDISNAKYRRICFYGFDSNFYDDYINDSRNKRTYVVEFLQKPKNLRTSIFVNYDKTHKIGNCISNTSTEITEEQGTTENICWLSCYGDENPENVAGGKLYMFFFNSNAKKGDIIKFKFGVYKTYGYTPLKNIFKGGFLKLNNLFYIDNHTWIFKNIKYNSDESSFLLVFGDKNESGGGAAANAGIIGSNISHVIFNKDIRKTLDNFLKSTGSLHFNSYTLENRNTVCIYDQTWESNNKNKGFLNQVYIYEGQLTEEECLKELKKNIKCPESINSLHIPNCYGYNDGNFSTYNNVNNDFPLFNKCYYEIISKEGHFSCYIDENDNIIGDKIQNINGVIRVKDITAPYKLKIMEV